MIFVLVFLFFLFLSFIGKRTGALLITGVISIYDPRCETFLSSGGDSLQLWVTSEAAVLPFSSGCLVTWRNGLESSWKPERLGGMFDCRWRETIWELVKGMPIPFPAADGNLDPNVCRNHAVYDLSWETIPAALPTLVLALSSQPSVLATVSPAWCFSDIGMCLMMYWLPLVQTWLLCSMAFTGELTATPGTMEIWIWGMSKEFRGASLLGGRDSPSRELDGSGLGSALAVFSEALAGCLSARRVLLMVVLLVVLVLLLLS